MVLDDVHTDFTRTPRVKAAARRFIEQNFGTNDLAAVVFTGRGEDAQDFTNDQRLLVRAIDKFQGRKLQGATINRLQNARINPDTGALGPGDDKDEQERAFRARNAMSTIRRLSEFMAGVRGRRKAMLLVGEGVDYDIYEAVGLQGSTATSVLLDTHDAIAAATRGNVSIYAIDPRGLVTGGEDLITQSSTFPGRGAEHDAGGDAAVAGQPARAGGQHRRLCGREPKRSRWRVRSHRQGEQLLLRARLLFGQRPPFRPVPQARGAGQAAGIAGHPVAQRLLRGAGPAPEPAGAVAQCHAGRALGDAWPARCRSPACR